jgi:hypothetical protein
MEFLRSTGGGGITSTLARKMKIKIKNSTGGQPDEEWHP